MKVDCAQLNDYSLPEDRRVNALLLVWAVLNDATVDEAFEFLVHGIEPVHHGREKPISTDEIKRLYDNGFNMYEIAEMFGVNASTISRRLKRRR